MIKVALFKQIQLEIFFLKKKSYLKQKIFFQKHIFFWKKYVRLQKIFF